MSNCKTTTSIYINILFANIWISSLNNTCIFAIIKKSQDEGMGSFVGGKWEEEKKLTTFFLIDSFYIYGYLKKKKLFCLMLHNSTFMFKLSYFQKNNLTKSNANYYSNNSLLFYMRTVIIYLHTLVKSFWQQKLVLVNLLMLSSQNWRSQISHTRGLPFLEHFVLTTGDRYGNVWCASGKNIGDEQSL